MPGHQLPDVPLPSRWARNVKSAVLHVISLAHFAIVSARGWTGNNIGARVRPAGGISARVPATVAPGAEICNPKGSASQDGVPLANWEPSYNASKMLRGHRR